MSELASLLAQIVGPRYVLDRAGQLLAYASDALPGYRKTPSLAVFPGARDEAIQIVRLLGTRGTPFVPRGAGTGLSGGALADADVVIGMQRLRRIVSLDADNRLATVEPGVVNAHLTRAAAPYGLHYAPDPSSQAACTIGGNVAENAGGPHCLKYGVTLNHVVAASVVLTSGEVITLGGMGPEAEGYDLLGTWVGSEGCFGLTLDVTVRLTPNPEAVRTLLADFISLDEAAHAVSAIVASGIVPAALEMMDRGTIRAVEASIYAAGYPTDAAAVLLIELDGMAAGIEHDTTRVGKLCRAHGARSLRIASDESERAKLWQGRKKAFGAMGRVSSHLVVQDAVVPRTQLPAVLRAIMAIGDEERISVCNVFHAGDGNLHPNVPYNAHDPDERERVERAMRRIMDVCVAAGGSVTGEHGIGLDKLDYMQLIFSGDSMEAMCRLREAFDPLRLANPGKVLPMRSCREWHGTPALRVQPVAERVPMIAGERK